MPVPTDTFRDIKKLNILFAVVALAMLGSLGALIGKDYVHPWRNYQKDAQQWEAALTAETAQRHVSAQTKREIEAINNEIRDLKAKLASDTALADAKAKLARATAEKNNKDLPLALVKGELGPLQQKIERATLEYGDRSPQVEALLKQYQTRYREFNEKFVEMVRIDAEIKEASKAISDATADSIARAKRLAELTREQDGAKEKLKTLQPGPWARIGQEVRNMPLANWLNPNEGVRQVVTPLVRTDVNFLTVETTDRCVTCHVNIDKPAFEEHNLIAFMERQVALDAGQDVDRIKEPVVMMDFWRQAAGRMPAPFDQTLKAVNEKTLAALNELRSTAGMTPADEGMLPAELVKLTTMGDTKDKEGNVAVTADQWYTAAVNFSHDLRDAFRKNLGKEDFKSLLSLYRHTLTDKYNEVRARDGHGKALSDSMLQLAHPNLGLFVDAESKHPISKFGCTACHEGSGQETIFEHTAHTPREIFVDARTGAPVPKFLVMAADKSEAGAGKVASASAPIRLASAEAGKSEEKTEGKPGAKSDAAAHAAPEAGHAPAAHGGHAALPTTHDDVKITEPGHPAPYAPEAHEHADRYDHPTMGVRGVVTQQEYWTKAYGWAEVHYMHWEKPMHSLDYVESSCAKCHTKIFDLKDTAPKLYEGRQLFVQMGCIDCHAVNSVIKNDADAHAKFKDYANGSPDKAEEPVARKVGPSLVHVKEKLSPEMLGSWIWSPKAFRPTTRMPHFFMLENNSSPVDILRTRVETAAITHYLLNTRPGKESVQPEYKPEPPPETTGSAAHGKDLFNTLGCLACHNNLSETAEKWVVEDMVKRVHLSEEAATAKFKEMSFNQQHWYVMEHLPEKLVAYGPDLSGVGTKLKAGRDEKQARAWVYDWVRNPRHYSSYTLMPSLRLSEQEANDLSAYLLGLERADYKPENFQNLDARGKAMLTELVAQLNAGVSTLQQERENAAKKSDEEKLAFLGKKMISHYGCNSCHAVSGFETASPTCLNLEEAAWGLKDPHLLDFGYFDHAFDKQREEKPLTKVWKVKGEGLEANAPQVTALSDKDHSPAIEQREVAWESMDLERRPWLYHKLHNTRIYDRARTQFDGRLPAEGTPEVGRPYDKIKMPKFFLTDEQVHAIVTYVTSIRKPLVAPELLAATYSQAGLRAAHGRQVAEKFNCVGCHNIEGNEVHIQQFYDVLTEDGRHNFENLNNAPPRLIGQGSKTQPDWLHAFLKNIEPIRPWLKVRMPSFAITNEDATQIADYFAGASTTLAEKLAKVTGPIEAYQKRNPSDKAWYNASAVARQVAELREWGLVLDLTYPAALSARETSPEDLQTNWSKLLKDASFLSKVNTIEYPFPRRSTPKLDAERFARGEALFNQLNCVKCHAFGDEKLLQKIWELDHKVDPSKAAAKKSSDDEDEEEAKPVATGPVYSAPNLLMAQRRLQWDWFHFWLQHPATMQPGTKMPQWFPDGKSAFFQFPEEMRGPMEALYGYTGEQQMQLLMDYVAYAGVTHYTPNVERLTGAKKEVIELKPLPKPAELEVKADAGKAGERAGEKAGEKSAEESPKAEGAKPEAKAEPAAEVKEAPRTSSIELQEAPVADSKGTRVVGVIKFAGSPPKRKKVDVSGDAFCAKQHAGSDVFDPSLVINEDKSVSNVLVYIKSGLSAADEKSPAPAGVQAELDQHGCEYVPHVVGVVVNQPLLILNSDATLHNVKFDSKQNGVFNEGMPVKGMKMVKKFTKPELGALMKCDVHPWMGGVVHVMNNPYFAVSDVQGRFEIKGLPPGTYEVGTWHERDGRGVKTKTATLKIEADKSTRLDIELTDK